MEARIVLVKGITKGILHSIVIPYAFVYILSFVAGIWSLLGALWIVFALVVYMNMPEPKPDQVVARTIVQVMSALMFIYLLLVIS